MENNYKVLEDKLKHLFETIPNSCILQFQNYVDLICEWTKRINLISINDKDRIIERHILESISVLGSIKIPEKSTCLDLGSGAGFPGIPLKIVRPDFNMTLLDSKRMKCLFLKKVVKTLELPSTDVVCERVEMLQEKSGFNACFDLLFIRGISGLYQLWKWASPLLKKDGKMVVWKGGDIEKEIKPLRSKYSDINIEVFPVSPYFVNPSLNRKIVVVAPI